MPATFSSKKWRFLLIFEQNWQNEQKNKGGLLSSKPGKKVHQWGL